MSGWYCAACGHRQGAGGACPRDQQALAQAVGLLGTAAGNFTLVEVVGRGGMGEVLRAVNPMLGATVAVKVLHATVHGPDAARFLTEARAVNRIAHDGVVKVLDGGYLESGRPYLVMELLDGASLAQVREARPVPVDETVRVIDEVLDIVGAAHAAGIVHRDLKPANVFLARRGRTMVLDFGVAKLLDGDASVTRTGAMIGTPGYMAPEQIHAGGVDARTDIYAIGVMLYELLVGRPPFDGASPFHIARAHVSQPVPRLPPVVAQFQPILDQALAKDPAQRFPSAAAMRSALAAGARGATASSSKRRWWLAVGALAAVGLTVGIVAGTRREASTSTAVVASMPGSAAVSPPVVDPAASAPAGGGNAASDTTTSVAPGGATKPAVVANAPASSPPPTGGSKKPTVAGRTPGGASTNPYTIDDTAAAAAAEASASPPSVASATPGPPPPPGARANPYVPGGDGGTPTSATNKATAPTGDLPAECERFLAVLDRMGHCGMYPPGSRQNALESARNARDSWTTALKTSPGGRATIAASCAQSAPVLEQKLVDQHCP